MFILTLLKLNSLRKKKLKNEAYLFNHLCLTPVAASYLHP